MGNEDLHLGTTVPTAFDAPTKILFDDPSFKPYADHPLFKAYLEERLGMPIRDKTKDSAYPFLLSEKMLAYHTFILARTGMGKTMLLKFVFMKLVVDFGYSAIFFDPKGGEVRELLSYLLLQGIPPERITVFDPSQPSSVPGFNLFQMDLPIQVIIGILAKVIEDVFPGGGARWPEVKNHLLAIIATHRLSWFEAGIFLIDETYREKLLKKDCEMSLPYKGAHDFFTVAFKNMSKSEQANIVAPLTYRFKSFTNSDFMCQLLNAE